MAKFKKIFSITFVFVLVITSQLNAQIDYAKNEKYYRELCAKKSSYNANRAICSGFEKYLSDKRDASNKSIESIKKAVENTQGDIQKILELIKENEKLINAKTGEIQHIKKDIKFTKDQIKKLEEDLLSRLALMQELDSSNFVVDFIMSSTSLDDFFTKMDGINAINASNNEVVNDLNDQRKKLDAKEKKLVEEEKQLLESKAIQDKLLKEYRTQEADLFERLAVERKKNASYNSQLDNLNLKDLEDKLNNAPAPGNNSGNSGNNNSGGNSNPGNSNSGNNNSGNTNPGNGSSGGSTNSTTLGRPVSSATITAIAWYYPASFGGGWHPGIDFANRTGTAILSPGSGVVLMRGSERDGYGNYMVTAHQVGNDTYTFLYGHLNGYANVGSTISRGQTIGFMGSTGNSTGPHLHLEIFRHRNRTLSQVVNTYKSNWDIYFGLGYRGTSSGAVSRLKPHEYYGLRMGQVF